MALTERWAPVRGWEGLYEVSSEGRVRSLPRQVAVGGGGTRTMGGNVLQIRPGRGGYITAQLHRSGEKASLYVHRMMLDAFVGPQPGMVSRHKNDKPFDNRIENLEWGTQSDNMADMDRNGHRNPIVPVGADHYASKLTENDVLLIRGFRGRITSTALAKRYGVTATCISDIWRRDTWKHI